MLTRWRRLYEAGGFDALVPSPRQPAPRTPEEVLALAAALKRENPGRTAAQVRRILRHGRVGAVGPDPAAAVRAAGADRPPRAEEDRRAFGRFECARPNEMWTGDTLHGPVIGGKKTYLFAFIDDHSRAVMGARWAYRRGRRPAGRRVPPGAAARGVPGAVYVDYADPPVMPTGAPEPVRRKGFPAARCRHNFWLFRIATSRFRLVTIVSAGFSRDGGAPAPPRVSS